MIKSFKHKGLKEFFTENNKRYLTAKDIPKITRILDVLDCAAKVKDVDIPGWNLHPLLGNRINLWAVNVNKNWRITFKFEKYHVYEVNLEDYH